LLFYGGFWAGDNVGFEFCGLEGQEHQVEGKNGSVQKINQRPEFDRL